MFNSVISWWREKIKTFSIFKDALETLKGTSSKINPLGLSSFLSKSDKSFFNKIVSALSLKVGPLLSPAV